MKEYVKSFPKLISRLVLARLTHFKEWENEELSSNADADRRPIGMHDFLYVRHVCQVDESAARQK